MRARRWMPVLVAVVVVAAVGLGAGLAGGVLRGGGSHLDPVVGTWDLADPGFAPRPQMINLVVDQDESFTLTMYGGQVTCTGAVAAESDALFRFVSADGPCGRFTATPIGDRARLRVDWDKPGGSDNDTLVLR